MTNILEFSNQISGTGLLDKTVKLSCPLELPKITSSTGVKVQPTSIQISDRIPNIFDGTPFGIPFNNTLLRVGTDTQPYVTVWLWDGLYFDSNAISDAINAAINANLFWWTNPADPGLAIITNSVADRFVISIDSTKLNPLYGTQFRLDLRYAITGSTLATTLGFPTTTLLVADGDYPSPSVPVMDTQGTACVIIASFSPQRRHNDTSTRVLATVPFAGKTTPSDNVWPASGQLSPMMSYRDTATITEYTINVKTTAGQPMLFLGGQLLVTVAFYW